MLRGSTELFEGQRKGRAKTWALGRATLAPMGPEEAGLGFNGAQMTITHVNSARLL